MLRHWRRDRRRRRPPRYPACRWPRPSRLCRAPLDRAAEDDASRCSCNGGHGSPPPPFGRNRTRLSDRLSSLRRRRAAAKRKQSIAPITACHTPRQSGGPPWSDRATSEPRGVPQERRARCIIPTASAFGFINDLYYNKLEKVVCASVGMWVFSEVRRENRRAAAVEPLPEPAADLRLPARFSTHKGTSASRASVGDCEPPDCGSLRMTWFDLTDQQCGNLVMPNTPHGVPGRNGRRRNPTGGRSSQPSR